MHYLSFQTLSFLLAALVALSCATSHKTNLGSAIYERSLEAVNDDLLLSQRDLAASLYVHSALEARHNPNRVLRRSALPEPYPQLAFLGGALRGAGKGLSKAPEKAGGKAAKEQGKNGGQQSNQDAEHQRTADRMAANLKKMGKDPDPKCLKQLVDTFSIAGGVNGNYERCWTKPSKEEQERAKLMDNARKTIQKNEGKAKKALGWGR